MSQALERWRDAEGEAAVGLAQGEDALGQSEGRRVASSRLGSSLFTRRNGRWRSSCPRVFSVTPCLYTPPKTMEVDRPDATAAPRHRGGSPWGLTLAVLARRCHALGSRTLGRRLQIQSSSKVSGSG